MYVLTHWYHEKNCISLSTQLKFLLKSNKNTENPILQKYKSDDNSWETTQDIPFGFSNLGSVPVETLSQPKLSRLQKRRHQENFSLIPFYLFNFFFGSILRPYSVLPFLPCNFSFGSIQRPCSVLFGKGTKSVLFQKQKG